MTADIRGQRFGRLVAVAPVGNYKWHCECDCGGFVKVKVHNLRSGNTRSCGCLRREKARSTALRSFCRRHPEMSP